LKEPGRNRREVRSISEEGEATPRPKRTAQKIQVVDDGITDIASTDDPDWQIGQGGNDEHESETTDVGTVEEEEDTDTLGVDADDSDQEEAPRQKKGAKNLSKSAKQTNVDKGKRRRKLRDAILQGRQEEQSSVRPT
jgi:hypothetical protein